MSKAGKQVGMTWPPDLIKTLDKARGAVARSRMVQNCVRIVLADPKLTEDALKNRYDEPKEEVKKA